MNFKRMAGFMLALVLILSQLPAQVLAAGSVPAAGPAAVTGLNIERNELKNIEP